MSKKQGCSRYKPFFLCQKIHENEEEEIEACMSKVKDVLGEKHEKYYQRILRLVMADGAYCEGSRLLMRILSIQFAISLCYTLSYTRIAKL